MILGKQPLGTPLGKDVNKAIARINLLTGEIESIHISFTPAGKDKLRERILERLK